MNISYASKLQFITRRKNRNWRNLSETRNATARWPAKLIAAHEKKYGPEYKAALRARNALFFVDLFEREGVDHIHVHFANRAAHTALFVKAISGMPFSVTAHGQDFMTDLGNPELLREICEAAEFVAAETNYSSDLLRARCPESADKILRVYNGIELKKFPAPAPRSKDTIRILSVGRLVEFKGFDVLLDACAKLPDRNFICEIIGEGPVRAELETRTQLSGERSQEYVLNAFANCDIFVLAARVDQRGASDVFPTVIAEAMTSAKPVVSTTVAGIPELVAHEETGLLVPPDDPDSLGKAILRLMRDKDLRERFGRAGRERIEKHFTIEKTIEPLLQRFVAGHRTGAHR